MLNTNVVAIVGARLNSSRLPKKHLKELSGKPLIERVFERLERCTTLTRHVLATTNDPYNQALVDWAISKSKHYLAYSGDVNNLMGRINEAVILNDADILVYICGDCPLIEPKFIDHAVKELAKNPEADIINLSPGVTTLHEGIDIYSRKGWNTLFEHSRSPEELEHVGLACRAIDEKPALLKPCFIDDCSDFSKVKQRVSVDTTADLEFMQHVYSRWYTEHKENSIVDLEWVQDLLTNDTSLSAINAHVQQKNPRIQYQSVTLYCHASKEIGLGHLGRVIKMADALQTRLGLGTTIHILGDTVEINGLHTKYQWHHDSGSFFQQLEKDESSCCVLDFHPDFIDTQRLSSILSLKKELTTQKIIAIDKLTVLLSVADLLYIPCFYTNTQSEKVSYGWDHYFIERAVTHQRKKRITVLTGGSDALGFGDYLPELIECCQLGEWEHLWIQGPYASTPNLIDKENWQLKQNPENLSQVIAESEIVISTYGTSFFEAIANAGSVLLLPCPEIYSPEELDRIKQSNICITSDERNQISERLVNLASDTQLRKKLKVNCKAVFNGKTGAETFSQKVQELLVAGEKN